MGRRYGNLTGTHTSGQNLTLATREVGPLATGGKLVSINC
jgi:hypothetical protein